MCPLGLYVCRRAIFEPSVRFSRSLQTLLHSIFVTLRDLWGSQRFGLAPAGTRTSCQNRTSKDSKARLMHLQRVLFKSSSSELYRVLSFHRRAFVMCAGILQVHSLLQKGHGRSRFLNSACVRSSSVIGQKTIPQLAHWHVQTSV